MARRRNAITHRFARMRGLPREEKQLLLRIGNLMDVALNNRQASNPYEPRRNKPSRVIYPPTGLTAATGLKAVKLVWNAANSDEHLRYEVEVRDLTEGDTVTRSSYTNNITYYGAGGTYEAKVWSVGRNGRSSEPQTIQFDIGADVMQIEGAKLGVIEKGALIQDDIYHLSGYMIFVWGSVVVDKYIAGSGNPDIVFKLWRKKGDDAQFTNAVTEVDPPLELLETITLYPATEDASNLSDSALGGQNKYIRYDGLRLGSFGTSQSVMFTPISVADDEVDERWTYFLQSVGRTTEDDEVSLSITIWAGAEGQSNTQPGDPYHRADYVFPHYNHFHTWNTLSDSWDGVSWDWDSRWAVATILEGYYLPANQWTIGFWWRPEGLIPSMTTANPKVYGGINIFQKEGMGKGIYDTWDQNLNRIWISANIRGRDHQSEWAGAWQDSNWVHQMDVQVTCSKGNQGALPDGQNEKYWFSVRALVMDDDYGTSALFPYSTLTEGSGFNDGWCFTIVCFEGRRNLDSYKEGSYIPDTNPPEYYETGYAGQGDIFTLPAIRVWHNMGVHPDWINFPDEEINHFTEHGMRNLQLLAQIGTADQLIGFNNVTDEWEAIREGPMYMSNPSHLSTFGCIQDDRNDNMVGWGCTVSHANYEGRYQASCRNNTASACQWYQAGIWSMALDGFTGYDEQQAAGTASVNYLYNVGRGYGVNWRINSEIDRQVDGSEFDAYPAAGSLCHLWQFGAIELPFSSHETLRDTGFHVYGGGLNLTSEINPFNPAGEHRSNLTPPNVPATSESWGNTCGIWDVRSPNGTNGTTQSNVCYPGQNL